MSGLKNKHCGEENIKPLRSPGVHLEHIMIDQSTLSFKIYSRKTPDRPKASMNRSPQCLCPYTPTGVRHFAFPFLDIFSRYYPILCHYAAEILIRPNDVKVNSDKGDNLIPNKGRIKPNKPFAGKPEKYIPRSIPVT